MIKLALALVVALSFTIIPASALPTIEIKVDNEKINSLEPILITGKITEASQYIPVKLFVTDPQKN